MAISQKQVRQELALKYVIGADGTASDSNLGYMAAVPDIVVPAGAVGDNSNNDTSALQDAADECAETGKTLYIPDGTFRFTTLDFREIRNIMCRGTLRCTQAGVGEAIKVGSSVSAPLRLLRGHIALFVDHVNGVNTALDGSVGVRLYGASHCFFTIHTYFFDTGILISPENTDEALYFAFNELYKCRTYGCATGLHILTTGIDEGWINENRVSAGSFSPAGGSLAQVAGIRISDSGNGGVANHNRFDHVHLESWTSPGCPILVEKGVLNVFDRPRLEASDPIVIGDGTDAAVGGNVFIDTYNQIGVNYPKHTWQAPYVNWFLPSQGAEWTELRNITIEDWQQDPDETGGYCPLFTNTVGGTSEFSAATFTDDAWKTNSTHRATMWVPVQTGDIIAIDLDVVSGTNYMLLSAQDISKANLASLTSGDLPYIGSNDVSTPENNTSGTSHAPGTITSTNYFRWQFVSINRSEVRFLKIELHQDAELRRVVVRKLVRNNIGAEVTSGPVEPTATIIQRATAFY